MYNTTTQVNSQIQSLLQQMQQSEQQNAVQLRQLAGQIEQISSHESAASRQIQHLQQLCNQLVQENQRITQVVQGATTSTFNQPLYSQVPGQQQASQYQSQRSFQ